jgi:polyphosphate kinase
MKEDTIPYLHRDISWLSFNYRVLQEAMDPSVPLFEQIKFLAIYSSNLNEFFRVRVANHRNLLRLGKKTKKQLEFEPKQIMNAILDIVNHQQEEFSNIFENQIIPALRKYNIYLLRRTDLNASQIDFVENYFQDKLLPFVQPVLLRKQKIRPFLNNGALYLAVWLKDNAKHRIKNEFAVLKIPSDHLPRFVELPSPEGREYIIMLDDIVRHSLKWLFPGYDIEDS